MHRREKTMRRGTKENPEKNLTFTVQSEDQESSEDMTVTPRKVVSEEGVEYGQIGVYQAFDSSLKGKLMAGFIQTWTIITSIFGLVLSMFTRGFDINAFGGPLAIYAATEEVASYGFMSIISFLGYLSVNLGTVNLFPIPALDGGKLILNLIEGIRGKPLEPEKEGIITVVGVVLLLILMVLITWNDIQRFFLG